MDKVETKLRLSGKRELRRHYSKGDFEWCRLTIDAVTSEKFLNKVL